MAQVSITIFCLGALIFAFNQRDWIRIGSKRSWISACPSGGGFELKRVREWTLSDVPSSFESYQEWPLGFSASTTLLRDGNGDPDLIASRSKIPYWFFLTITTPLPLIYYRRRSVMIARHGRGLCPACGHELPPTADRCPGCGNKTSDEVW